MRSYRKEVFRYLATMVSVERHPEAAKGQLMLCAASISSSFTNESLDEGLTVVDVRRTKIRRIRDLLELLWGLDDDMRRGSWVDAPFRVLCRRAKQLVAEYCGAEEAATFHDLRVRGFNSVLTTPVPQLGYNIEGRWVGFWWSLLSKSMTTSSPTSQDPNSDRIFPGLRTRAAFVRYQCVIVSPQ